MEPGSLQATLTAARARAREKHTTDFAIPGSEGSLWGTFRVITDYGEAVAILAASSTAPDEERQTLYLAAETLARSCETTYALIDGERHPLDMGLGVDLARAHYGDEVENDRQAIFAIFPDTMSVMSLYRELEEWSADVRRGINQEHLGNSEAPPS